MNCEKLLRHTNHFLGGYSLSNEPIEKKEQSSSKGAGDFVVSIVLIAFAIWAIITAQNYRSFFGDEFYIQPGFTPTVICSAILIMSIVLLVKSLKGSSIKERCIQVKNGVINGLKSREFWNVVVAIVLFALYILVLLKYLPFWAATFLIVAVILFYLKATKWWKILIIAAGSTALVIIIFQKVFGTLLP